MISCKVLIVITSKAANGSSKSNILGLEIRAIAITNFFFWPPERNSALISLIGSNSNLEIKESIFSFLKLGFSIVISAIAFKFS